MAHAHDNLETLKKQIVTAFADVPYPGDNDLAYPINSLDDERFAIMDFFRGKAWQDVHPENRDFDYHDLLTLSSPTAFVYYLPAFLVSIIEMEELSTIADFTLYCLTPDGPEDDFVFPRLQLLSKNQRQAVKDFVSFVVQRHYDDITIDPGFPALQSYWLMN